VGPRDGLARCGKILPPPGFEPQTIQSIVSYYTDAIPSNILVLVKTHLQISNLDNKRKVSILSDMYFNRRFFGYFWCSVMLGVLIY
jgi:hypothetical protein